MSGQMQHGGRLAGQFPNERQSAWRGAGITLECVGSARAFYASVPLHMRPAQWTRNKVQGLSVAMRDLGDMREADFPESWGWSYIGYLEQRQRALYATPVRTWDALKPVETHADAHEDIATCEVELARAEYVEGRGAVGPTRLLNALDAQMARDCETIGVASERISLCAREKAALMEGPR